MSLQVWLPLISDLHNQGVSGLTPVQTTAPTWVDGKLGKAMSTGALYLPANDVAKFYNNNAMSFAFWIYAVGSSGSGVVLGQEAMSAGNNRMFTIFQYPSPNDLHLSWQSNESGTTFLGSILYGVFPSDTWTHCAIAYDGAKASIYINGEYRTSWNGVSTRTNFAYDVPIPNKSIRYLNDLRIYNHCLSAKEVKELSKGLVAHYTLNGSGRGCDNILTNSSGYNGTSDWGGLVSVGNENGTPYLISKRTDTITTTRTFVTHSAITSLVSSWATGDKFTMSGYYRVPSNETYAVQANMFIRWGASTSTSDTGFYTPSSSAVVKDTWIRFEYTFEVPSYTSGSAVNFYLSAFSQGLSTVHWKYLKLEKGDKATPWLPNSSDAQYSAMGYNDTTVYDSSGFNHHGQTWAYDSNGSIEISSGTPRYSVSTYINSSDNTTSTASGTRYIYGQCALTTPSYLTVAFWCKAVAGYNSSTGQGQFCLTMNDIGINAGTDYNTVPMHHRDSCIDICTSEPYHKTVPINFGNANEWHHHAIVYDGRYGKVYKDGVYVTQVDMGSTMPLASMKAIVIGYSHAGGVIRSNKSYYSDFRLYATALSADDIKELYQVGASIDKSGNMYAYEFNEV